MAQAHMAWCKRKSVTRMFVRAAALLWRGTSTGAVWGVAGGSRPRRPPILAMPTHRTVQAHHDAALQQRVWGGAMKGKQPEVLSVASGSVLSNQQPRPLERTSFLPPISMSKKTFFVTAVGLRPDMQRTCCAWEKAER